MVQTKERMTERLLVLVTPSEKLALQQMAEATDQSAGQDRPGRHAAVRRQLACGTADWGWLSVTG